MTKYRPGQAAELLGVSVDTVRRWADEGRLKTTRTAGGHRHVDGKDLARLLKEQAPTSERGITQSARNRFTGIVIGVQRDKLTAIVEIQAGPHRVVSLMTREGADELGLAVGDLAVAAVKATNVVVELRPAE
ncbi:MAG: MerR family DNA-binding transcriptional regulator [Acidimicrobiia bacterium]